MKFLFKEKDMRVYRTENFNEANKFANFFDGVVITQKNVFPFKYLIII